MNTQLKEWLSRKEAAAHLTVLGYPTTPRTLERLAQLDSGPPYRLYLARTSYRRQDLEDWAKAHVVEGGERRRQPALARGALSS